MPEGDGLVNIPIAVIRTCWRWRLGPAALLSNASAYYLDQATTSEKGAADQLEALASHRGLIRDQTLRLRSAAAAAVMAAAVAEPMRWELLGCGVRGGTSALIVSFSFSKP